MICPFCSQERVGPRDECGGIDDGICDAYSIAIDSGCQSMLAEMMIELHMAGRTLGATYSLDWQDHGPGCWALTRTDDRGSVQWIGSMLARVIGAAWLAEPPGVVS